MIDVSAVKIYCDGVMENPAHTAAMLEPYRVNAGTADKPDWRPGTLRGPDPSCADARAGFVELDKAVGRSTSMPSEIGRRATHSTTSRLP
jgi:hypothetical protein